MSTLAKGRYLLLRTVAALVLAVAMAACGTNDQEVVAVQDLQDTASIVEAKVDTTDHLHVSADSTLHKVQEITIKAVGNDVEEVKFDTDTIEVMAGALVKLNLINEGTGQSMIHNIVITNEGQYRRAALEGAKAGSPGNYIPKDVFVLAASSLALPGQTVELEFQAPLNPDVYDFVCTYPDHYKRMHGKVVVK